MTRLLVALFLVVIVLPHIVPVPDRPVQGAIPTRTLREVSDDGKSLPSVEEFEKLASEDAIAMLEICIRRYDREVKSYHLIMQKQERLDGKLEKKEIMEVHFREGPHSVQMKWREGARLAARALYVEGENEGKALIKPSGLGGFLIVSRDPEGEDARKSGRYTLKEFGLKKGMQRALNSLEGARKQNALHIEYLGTKKVKEAGDRTCHVLRRSRYKQPEADGVTEMTLFVDVENWLLVGSILKGEGGKLIGEYFFREIQLNPTFPKDVFTRKALEAR